MSTEWAFFLKQQWIVSAKNLLKLGEQVDGEIGGTHIKIIPRTSHSAEFYEGDFPKNRAIPSADALIEQLLAVGNNIPQEQLIEEIDDLLKPYYY